MSPIPNKENPTLMKNILSNFTELTDLQPPLSSQEVACPANISGLKSADRWPSSCELEKAAFFQSSHQESDEPGISGQNI